MKVWFVRVAAFGLFNLSCVVAHAQQLGKTYRGKASYYAKYFNGKKTASGERFDTQELTAAHKTLPFGTMVEVTNLSNQKICVVRITDRGPFKPGRVIDLTYAAAKRLGMTLAGLANVSLRVVGTDGIVMLRPGEGPFDDVARALAVPRDATQTRLSIW
jgi:rare lipoprotein A